MVKGQVRIVTALFGIYRDDGNIVFRGKRSSDESKDWLFHFQELVNEEAGGNDIQFTMEIWKPGEESRTIVPKKLKVVGAKTFPYLDMEMRFDESQNLCFGVHTKPGYQQKYLNVGSHHTSATKNAVVRGVSIRIAGLTTRTATNSNVSLSKAYPGIHGALKAAGYLADDSQLPKLGEILNNRERERMQSLRKKEEWQKDKRNVYCMSAYSGHWRTARQAQEEIWSWLA